MEEILCFPEELTVGEEKHVKLFWDTSDAEKGKYTALAFVNACTEIAQSKPIGITIAKSSPFLHSFDVTTANIIMIIIGTILHIRKKLGSDRT
ncbi:hypothetical protein C5S29_11790 [ANME-1 cluster archaeon GoMg3.2]|nr:hypothetical protein [ANME-1 cluster archaeon GoMg3.2]